MLVAADEAGIMVSGKTSQTLLGVVFSTSGSPIVRFLLTLDGMFKSQYEDGVRTGRRVAGSATTPLEHYFLSTDPSFTLITQVVNLALAELLLVSKI